MQLSFGSLGKDNLLISSWQSSWDVSQEIVIDSLLSLEIGVNLMAPVTQTLNLAKRVCREMITFLPRAIDEESINS